MDGNGVFVLITDVRPYIMDFDFSQLNLQYLIQARDLAKQDPELAAVILGIEAKLADKLAQVTPIELAQINCIRVPLIKPYDEFWWWSRFLEAIKIGNPVEIEVLLEHANLAAIKSS